MQNSVCDRCAGRVVGVVVLRAAVSTIGFEWVSLRVIGSDRYLYANPNANSLGHSSRGGGRCVYNYSSLSSWLQWEHYNVGEFWVSGRCDQKKGGKSRKGQHQSNM